MTGNLLLFQFIPGNAFAGYASGGFSSNVKVSGAVYSGSQQQWMSKNCQYRWIGSNWNMVSYH